MKISIQSLLDGARNASGAVAVIDTFRAFTTAAVALANGASRIIMVATVEEALALRAADSGSICMGRSEGRRHPASITGIRRLRSPQSISAAGPSFSAPVPEPRASLPPAPEPTAFMRPPW
jgi:phosphosulfolactate phosphohydrolase-like enzyme